MGTLPPLQVTVDAKGWSCVLDLRLALARHGPMLALRLAEELRVCLVPRLWYVLDNTEHYRRRPADLVADATAADTHQMPDPESLAQWERARLDIGLPVLSLYWAGDALHESFMPKDVDSEVVQRFDRFGHDLEQRLTRAGRDWEPALPLVGGAIDTAALAAAMTRYRPLVLTSAGAEGEAPPLCRLLDAAGVPCRALTVDESRPLCRQLIPSFARSGALELCWAGLQLAVVHLVVPRAFLLPPLADLGPDLDDLDGEPPVTVDDVWQDASAYWYRLP